MPGTITNPGEVTLLFIPNLWNPHDPNTASYTNNALRPQLRLYAETTNPVGGGPWEIGATTLPNIANNQPTNPVLPAANCPQSLDVAWSLTNTELDFSDNQGQLFREPTNLWSNTLSGVNITPGTGNTLVPATGIPDANTQVSPTAKNPARNYYGLVLGKMPILAQLSVNNAKTPALNGNYVAQLSYAQIQSYVAASGGPPQVTFVLQYQDPNNSKNWITYNMNYPSMSGLATTCAPDAPSNYFDNGMFNTPTGKIGQDDTPADPMIVVGAGVTNEDPWDDGQIPLYVGGASITDTCLSCAAVNGSDPRTARFGVGMDSTLGLDCPSPNTNGSQQTRGYLLEPSAHAGESGGGNPPWIDSAIAASPDFSVMQTCRPREDMGDYINFYNPGMVTATGANLQMRLISGSGFSASLGNTCPSPNGWEGLLSQNNPTCQYLGRDLKTAASYYFEDADGICRRAMGAYASTTLAPTHSTDPVTSVAEPITSNVGRIGLPLATASTFTDQGLPTPLQQSQSRPIVLNRPFKSVSEMSYAFTGTPWKNIDFFTPESAYTGLLDTFCVGQSSTQSNPVPLIAGKVDLNTRQQPVLQALLSGATRDEWYSKSAPPSYAVPPLTSTEAALAAQRLVAYTTDNGNIYKSSPADVWRGPLSNVSDLVGHFVSTKPVNPQPIATGALPDWYTYVPPAPVAAGQVSTATYAGFTPLLDSTVYTYNDASSNSSLVSPIIQRFRESALRPLADCGQTRVWNLLIDVIAQVGRYPQSATSLSNFAVQGEKRLWIHVAIDRYTGQVLDKQVEVVSE